jgi:uncharacterized protein YjbJ (UPF0337 family)
VAVGAFPQPNSHEKKSRPYYSHSVRRSSLIDKWEDGVMSDGTSDGIKGRIKEAVGAATDNKQLRNEGRKDRAVGKMKKAVARVIDKAKG